VTSAFGGQHSIQLSYGCLLPDMTKDDSSPCGRPLASNLIGKAFEEKRIDGPKERNCPFGPHFPMKIGSPFYFRA